MTSHDILACLLSFGTLYSINLTGIIMPHETTPRFLFKIITLEQWNSSKEQDRLELGSDDALFIHLATENQLDRITEKYWTSVPSYIILKIESQALFGDLRLEANEGGQNRYYHLYNGFIPLEAVVESRLIDKGPFRMSGIQHSFKVVDIGHEVLRRPAKPVPKEEILSEEVQEVIQRMIVTMRTQPGVGIAAPQVGIPLQIFIVEDKAEYHEALSPEQMNERDRKVVPLQVVINPTLHFESDETAEFFEGCLSVPHFVGIVPRAKKVNVEGLNERGDPIVIQAEGWHARILQHEYDHLQGILYTDRVLPRSLMTKANYLEHWNALPIEETKRALLK